MASTSSSHNHRVIDDKPPTYESVISQTPPSYDFATQQPKSPSISYIELPEEQERQQQEVRRRRNDNGSDGSETGEERSCKVNNSFMLCVFVVCLFALGLVKYMYSPLF